MARIAITGGTGFVGTHVSRALLANGHQVRLIGRGSQRRPKDVEFVRANVVAGTGLADAFTGCDAVIHLVAVIRESRKQTFDAVNRRGTENVAAAARQAEVRHIIHMSAIGVDPDPYFAYLASKWAGEQAVIAGGTPYTIIRSSLIFGPGDGFFTVLVKLVRRSPFVPIVGNGRALFQPIAVSDVARVITQCVANGPDNGIHEIGGPEYLTYQDIVKLTKTTLGVHRGTIHIPIPLMTAVAIAMDKLLPNPPVTPDQLRLLKKNNITRLDAIERAWGFVPQRLADNCDYLRDY